MTAGTERYTLQFAEHPKAINNVHNNHVVIGSITEVILYTGHQLCYAQVGLTKYNLKSICLYFVIHRSMSSRSGKSN